MHTYDAAVTQALGTRKPDVILQQRLLCAGACQADHQRDIEQRKIECRQQQMPQTVQRQKTDRRSEEHTSELQSLMRISYAVFCLKKKNNTQINLQRLTQ